MKSVSILILLAVTAFAVAGCRGMPAPGEKQARQDLKSIAEKYQPGQPPKLPELTPDSSLSNYLAFALLNSPTVAAAFYDWSASVENITIVRSRPDPQITFQSYIEDELTSLMPGFMWNFPGPGKLKAKGRAAAAESEGKYFAFESAVLQAAFNLKSAYFKLGELDEQLRIEGETLSLVNNEEAAARAQNVAGSTALADVFRIQDFCDRARTDLANLEDSRHSLLANFKAALGLMPNQPNPPIPAHFEISVENPDADELLREAFARNPQLKAMEAKVRAAEAGITVAYKDRLPDFNAGLSVEVYRPPFYWPQGNMTLPIWRDKLAAEVAQAQANKLAAQSRLKAGQIELAVSFADKSFSYRETGRNLALLQDELIPRANQTLAIARAGYRTGTVDISNLTDTERAVLDLKLEAVQTRTDREIALSELSLMVAGVAPTNAPLLTKNSHP
jgi:outer membrane protein TolC